MDFSVCYMLKLFKVLGDVCVNRNLILVLHFAVKTNIFCAFILSRQVYSIEMFFKEVMIAIYKHSEMVLYFTGKQEYFEESFVL